MYRRFFFSMLSLFSLLAATGEIKAAPDNKSAEKAGIGASILFEDNFDGLPLGNMNSDKWNSGADAEENVVEIVQEDGRGKVVHVRANRKKAFLVPRLAITGLPYIIEFDLKVPAAKPQGGNKTVIGRLNLFYQTNEVEKNKRPDWVIALRDYCYTLSIPKRSKSHYKPTQSTGKDWGHVKVEVDSDQLRFYAKPDTAKVKNLNHMENFEILPADDKTGELCFRARVDWGYEIAEFWLDNVTVRLKPAAERNAYKQKAAVYQELEAAFKTKEYCAAAGSGIPAELTEAGKLLKEIAALPDTAADQYKDGLKKLDQLFEKCSGIYRQHEPAVFAAAFPGSKDYKPLDISAFYNHTPLKRDPAFSQFTPLVKVESIPFRVSPVAPYTRQFSLLGKTSLEIPVGQTANEIFFLLQPHWELDFQGNGVYPEPSFTYNEGPITLRDITSSGSSEAIQIAFQVEIRYKDGERERAVPLRLSTMRPEMAREKVSVFTVLPSQKKPIASIILHDQMNDWAGCLYGVTLGTGKPHQIAEEKAPVPAKTIEKGPASVKIDGDGVVFESPAYRMRMAKTGVLRLTEFLNKYSDRNFLLGNSGSLLLTGPFTLASKYSKLTEDSNGGLTPEKPENPHFSSWQIRGVQENAKDEVFFEIENSEKTLSGTLLVKAEFDQIRMEATLKNNGKKAEELAVIFPLIKRINAHGYFLPQGNGVISDRALDYDAQYGSNMYVMMQMLAAWDENKQSGISLRVEDTSGEMKTFRLYKAAKKGKPQKFQKMSSMKNHPDQIGPSCDGMMFGTQYYYFALNPGQDKKLPPAVLGVHPGTWKAPLQRYTEWVNTWFRQIRPVPERVRRVALSVTGGGLNEQSTHKTGLEWGGVDVVHLYFIHSADYLPEIEKKYVPGIVQTKKNYASRKPPIGLGIYAVEGSYLRTETKLFGDIGHKWSLKDVDGNVSYFQALTKDQVRVCRANPEWHKALADMCAMLAAKADPVWTYVDTVGVCAPNLCFDKEHVHGSSPAEEFRGILKEMETVTRAVQKANPNVGVLTEGPGCDYLMQYRDGSWSKLGPWETVNNPGCFMYFRYIRPTFKLIELGGDSITRSKINYFNGVPSNIYIYRGEDRTTKTLKPLVQGYRKFWDVLTGEEMEVDVPTGARGVYMNRFGSSKQGKMVYAVANWGNITWRGRLNLDYFPGAHYIEATNNDKELKFTVAGNQDKATVELSIDPYEVVYVGVVKK